LQLPNPLLQELPIRFLLGQRQSFLVREPALSCPAEPAVHIGAAEIGDRRDVSPRFLTGTCGPFRLSPIFPKPKESKWSQASGQGLRFFITVTPPTLTPQTYAFIQRLPHD